MKGVALNLTRSPEKLAYWERVELFILSAGHVAQTVWTSLLPPPRGLRQHRVTQRQASNQASDEQGALGESTAMEVPEYPAQC